MHDILLPMIAMMLLTFVVWLCLYFTRVRSMAAQRIHPQTVATRAQMAAMKVSDRATWVSDNFQNQFELPVIFYALCLAIAMTGMGDAVLVVLAWIFVLLRTVHATIHLTYNKVVHRFSVYVLGGAALFAMVFRFGWLLM